MVVGNGTPGSKEAARPLNRACFGELVQIRARMGGIMAPMAPLLCRVRV